MRLVSAFFATLGTLIASTAAMAAQPTPWQIWHQPAASDMMANIEWFDLYTLWFVIPITIFVLILLIILMVKFNAKANPTPSKTTHHVGLEAAWTILPIVILAMIAVPSFNLLNEQLAPTEEPDITIKAIGQQWYWDYEYLDGGEIAFSSIMMQESVDERATFSAKEISEKKKTSRELADKTDIDTYPRLLAVDNELVVPVNKMVRVLVTAEATGVIHNFALPAFGLKIDAIPGRLNETWFKANREGLFYGQCSELCGKDHAFMPIGIRVVSEKQYAEWKAAAGSDLDNANKALMDEIELKQNVKVAGN